MADGYRKRDWLKFVSGLILLGGMIFFFASGYSPPGVCGEVLRHNQANEIDASPLIYSEVENMAELEAGVRELRREARLRTETTDEKR
jgi:hypothetical protein